MAVTHHPSPAIMFGWSVPKTGKMKRAQRRKKKREYQPLEQWEAENEEPERPTDTPAEQSAGEEEVAGEAVAAESTAPRSAWVEVDSLFPTYLTEAQIMNSFTATQPSRQTPQLRNTQKSALGNGLGGWNTAGSSGFGLGGGLGAGLGSGLGGARPAQLSGFAQVMGGGSGQGPIDMR